MDVTEQQRELERAHRRDDIRRRLLGAVDQLTVGGDSYATVSIERLANAAGLSRATFYTYFDGKGDLLRAGFSDALEELGGACRPWLGLGTRPTQADMRAALHRIILSYRSHATLISAVYDEATQDSSLRDQLGAAITDAIDTLQAQIERGQRAGWADGELLARETAAWLVWLIERGLNQIIPSADDAQVDRLTDALAQMGWQTLDAESPGRH
jgi:AcrR family transcriptional regulator